MKVGKENYFSRDVAKSYLSNSQIHNFIGTPINPGCEARAMAVINGKFEIKKTKPMMIGSYVDAYFEGSMNEFKEKNPQIFKNDGTLYADFVKADEIIEYAENDEKFMQFMSGEKQIILKGKLFGHDCTGKVDVMHDDLIVDLKVMANMEPEWCGHEYGKLNFIDAWGYADQLAIYQELDYQVTGKRKLCYLAVLTKETQPDKDIIWIPQGRLDASLFHLEGKLQRIIDLKAGKETPVRCGKCDYCKKTKKITEIVNYEDLLI